MQNLKSMSGELLPQPVQTVFHAVINSGIAVLHDHAAEDTAVDAFGDANGTSELLRKRRPEPFLLIGTECNGGGHEDILGVLIIEHFRIEIISDLAEKPDPSVIDEQKEESHSKPFIPEDLLHNADAFGNGKCRQREQSCEIGIEGKEQRTLPEIGTGLLQNRIALFVCERKQRIGINSRNLRAHCTSPTESINSSISLA